MDFIYSVKLSNVTRATADKVSLAETLILGENLTREIRCEECCRASSKYLKKMICKFEYSKKKKYSPFFVKSSFNLFQKVKTSRRV